MHTLSITSMIIQYINQYIYNFSITFMHTYVHVIDLHAHIHAYVRTCNWPDQSIYIEFQYPVYAYILYNIYVCISRTSMTSVRSITCTYVCMNVILKQYHMYAYIINNIYDNSIHQSIYILIDVSIYILISVYWLMYQYIYWL